VNGILKFPDFSLTLSVFPDFPQLFSYLPLFPDHFPFPRLFGVCSHSAPMNLGEHRTSQNNLQQSSKITLLK